ncbi:MAG: N-6 DNA methylase, partial [Anaerolineales bacterium]|nr:N-6 DNA methylase [Anaerolineales bacterium]
MKTKAILTNYFKAITNVASQGDAREESFYSCLETLLQQFAASTGRSEVHVTTLPKKTEAGNPDFRVWNGQDRIIGYIEAKKPTEENLDYVETTDQLKRYRQTFPNLILTNLFEFRLYRDGQLVDRVLAARPRVLQLGAVPPVEKGDELLNLLEQFCSFSLPRSYTAESLAVELAKRTRFLRDVVADELREEQGVLRGFYQAFQTYLIANLTLEDFADLYAQTITYGLFAARTRAGDGFNRRMAYYSIPRTIGILRDVFQFISLGDLPKQLEWIVDDISEVLAVADAGGILDRFYREGKGSDPIVHFYETFLAQYDPQERERRGVYYTPEPVVSYIVRSLHQLLREKFGRSDGLASEGVTLLDPAAGTMTFVARACQEAVREFEGKYGTGGREEFIRQHILRNYYAFELMMAPYAVGHLKMSFFLEELGHRLSDDERFQFYLTNTLEMEELEQTHLPGMASLAQESRLAGEVKKQRPILVILGNPPYSGHSSNRGKWILGLIEDYKQVDGKPLGEKNPKWLQDDYVKFLRFAQWKIEQAGQGLVGMITNHSYLDNPTFRGMRQSLMQTFDETYVLDLHGNSLKRETCPDGSKDENVFDIRQGVAIAFFIKLGAGDQAKMYHADLWGLRQDKYDWLLDHDVEITDWQEIHPKPEFYLFLPRDEAALERYNEFVKVTEIFPVNSVGIVTARDRLTIHWTPDEAWQTVITFANMDPELARKAYKLRKDVRDWKVAWAQQDLKESGLDRDKIVPILYRPFDVRYTYYTGNSRGFHCMPRRDVMLHMLAGKNMGLCVGRAGQVVGSETWDLAYCASRLGDFNLFYRGGNVNLPLYLYPDTSKKDLFSDLEPDERKPNLNPNVVAALTAAYGEEPTPEDIFHY